MDPTHSAHQITTAEQLAALFGPVGEASVRKEVAYLHPHYCALIAASPFAILATSGPGGLDASPRGDAPGFVVVENSTTLLLPERRGNNRADSLHNLLADPRMALLFLIPGLGETLRVNGSARISVEPALLQRFVVQGQPPKCVLVVTVDAVFFQCARAIQRSALWRGLAADRPAGLPSPGTILSALADAGINAEKYDRELPERQRNTLY
ncbi:MAG: pyridoxamine 5'-phosphate oxidase family protein [Pseudomonadota bacterium]